MRMSSLKCACLSVGALDAPPHRSELRLGVEKVLLSVGLFITILIMKGSLIISSTLLGCLLAKSLVEFNDTITFQGQPPISANFFTFSTFFLPHSYLDALDDAEGSKSFSDLYVCNTGERNTTILETCAQGAAQQKILWAYTTTDTKVDNSRIDTAPVEVIIEDEPTRVVAEANATIFVSSLLSHTLSAYNPESKGRLLLSVHERVDCERGAHSYFQLLDLQGPTNRRPHSHFTVGGLLRLLDGQHLLHQQKPRHFPPENAVPGASVRHARLRVPVRRILHLSLRVLHCFLLHPDDRAGHQYSVQLATNRAAHAHWNGKLIFSAQGWSLVRDNISRSQLTTIIMLMGITYVVQSATAVAGDMAVVKYIVYPI